ncbi:MAG TPA: hypothetical protein VH592_26660 [Gemmataceae bacterium]|jgi:hypothetical protein
MAEKRTKEQITQDFRDGKIDAAEMMRQMREADRKPPRFAVAEKSGWLSIYFDGLRFPVSMPYECAVALFSDEQVAEVRAYLEANKSRFKVKNKGG